MVLKGAFRIVTKIDKYFDKLLLSWSGFSFIVGEVQEDYLCHSHATDPEPEPTPTYYCNY